MDRLNELGRLFLRLGALGFGGPLAHIALMEAECVGRRQWLTSETFLSVVAVTNLVPGPNSTEVAIHLGYLRAGRAGAIVAGLAFVLPAVAMVLVLAWLYTLFGQLPELGGLLLGIKPAAVALILAAAWKLGKKAITDVPQGVIALGAGVATVLLPGGELVALAVAGLVGYFPVLQAVLTRASNSATLPVLLALGWVFLKAGALLFGGGFVLIPLVEPEVVETYGWLSRAQFIDGIAVGQVTPGPIVTTATFVGFLAAGLPGALVATVAVFLPSFCSSSLALGHFSTDSKTPLAHSRLEGINAAVAGSIVAAGVGLGTAAVAGPWTGAILLICLVALVRFNRDGLQILGASALAGAIVSFLGGR